MKKPNFVKKTQPVFKKCSKVPLSLALAGAFFAPGLAATESRNVDLEEMAKTNMSPYLPVTSKPMQALWPQACKPSRALQGKQPHS